MTRHFLDLDKVETEDLHGILAQAGAMKTARAGRPKGAPDDEQPLAGRIVALIFDKPSTRTRISFDVGVRQMGGQTMVLSGADMQLGHGETIADTARVLSRYVDAVMLRTFDDTTLTEMAENATIPVINGLTDHSHPCQIMADVMTFEERRGPIKGKKVVWTGDGNNVCASFIQAAAKFGFDLTVTGPETLRPNPKIVEWARRRGAKIEIDSNPERAVQGADLVVTDTWLSMHDAQSARERRHNQLRPYQVNKALIDAAGSEPLFMHCLPAHRGEEATSEVMDGPNSVVFDEAENRLHAQKGILRWCLEV